MEVEIDGLPFSLEGKLSNTWAFFGTKVSFLLLLFVWLFLLVIHERLVVGWPEFKMPINQQAS